MTLTAIVCVADPSVSGPTIDHAVRLARWYGADLHLVRPEASEGEALLDLVTRNIKASLASVAAEDVDGVAAYVRSTSAGLVVIDQGLRGRAFARPGSLAAQIARRVSCPTVMVPPALMVPPAFTPPAGPAVFGNILHPTDLSPASLQTLEWALRFAQESGGRLTFLHVLDEYPYETVYSASRASRLANESLRVTDEVTRELIRRVPAEAFHWCDIQTRVVSGVPERQILRAATELNPDLIVMGIPVRHRVHNLLIGSTIGPVVRRSMWPLLMVPIRASIDRRLALRPVGASADSPVAMEQP